MSPQLNLPEPVSTGGEPLGGHFSGSAHLPRVVTLGTFLTNAESEVTTACIPRIWQDDYPPSACSGPGRGQAL